MNPDIPSSQDESVALAAYRDSVQESPGADLDARILQAAHAANAARPGRTAAGRMRRWSPLLATAAVAVLAVGITLRQPHPAVSNAPSAELPAPVMQPAVQRDNSTLPSNRETVRIEQAATRSAPAVAAKSRTTEAESAATREDSQQSTATRGGTDSAAPARKAMPPQRPAPTPHLAPPTPEPEPETPIFDEPLPMAVPAPPPVAAAPADAGPGQGRAVDAAAASGSAPVPESAHSADALKSRQPTPPTAADPEGARSTAVRESDSALAETRLRGARAERSRNDSALPQQQPADGPRSDERIAAVDAASIARGRVSLEATVRAVREAASRGEDARAEVLAAAASRHFGREALPPDVRVWAR